MNTLDNLNVHGHLAVASASINQLVCTSNDTVRLSSSHQVVFGSHTFDANQLGQLLTYLLSQHPELSV